MSNANYCASAITQRRQNKAIAGSFINRIQNGSDSTTSYGPLNGNFDQSVVSGVQEGQMTQYSKIAGTCTTVDPGCPCGVSTIFSVPQTCVLTNLWGTRFGGSLTDIGYGIAVGACGDTYVVGTWLSLTMDFYSFSQVPVGGGTIGTQLFGTMPKTNTNTNEVCYVAKLNSAGVVQWATKIEISPLQSLGASPGYAIALDSNENVYITGTYDQDITIYEGTLGGTAWGTLAKTSSVTNTVDTFLVKYNSNGQVQWATRVGGAGSSTQTQGIAIGNDQIYLAGYFNATIGIYSYTSGGGGGSAVTTTSIGTMSSISVPPASIDAMVVKYNTSGVAQWATKIGGTSREFGFDIAADSTGNAYITGYYISNPITIYNAGTSPFGTSFTLSTIANANPGSSQVFVVKYNGTGVGQWATRMGGTGQYEGHAIAADALGNVYVTGVFSQSINLYDAPGTSFGTNTMTNTNNGTNDAFVVKFGSSGQVLWGTKIGGTTAADESGEGIAVDTNGNVYVTGYYTSTTANVYSTPLGSGPPSFTLTNYGVRDVFLVKYNSTGTAVWATSMGGSAEDRGQAIALDSLANVYVTGQYASNPITFYNAPSATLTYGTLALIGGSADTFVVKYNTNGQIQ